jgi:hypothetical protein
MIDSRKIKADEEAFEATNKAVTEAIFRNKNEVTLEDVLRLKRRMIEDLWNYEFSTYEPDENGTISVSDWLRSVIVCMSGIKADRYLRRSSVVQKHFADEKRITLKEYMAF